MLSKNMSGTDRVFRILLALFLIAFSMSGRIGSWGWVIGLILLVTASAARCPMYSLLGFKPRKTDAS
jgi:hypothetical protein